MCDSVHRWVWVAAGIATAQTTTRQTSSGRRPAEAAGPGLARGGCRRPLRNTHCKKHDDSSAGNHDQNARLQTGRGAPPKQHAVTGLESAFSCCPLLRLLWPPSCARDRLGSLPSHQRPRESRGRWLNAHNALWPPVGPSGIRDAQLLGATACGPERPADGRHAGRALGAPAQTPGTPWVSGAGPARPLLVPALGPGARLEAEIVGGHGHVTSLQTPEGGSFWVSTEVPEGGALRGGREGGDGGCGGSGLAPCPDLPSVWAAPEPCPR